MSRIQREGVLDGIALVAGMFHTAFMSTSTPAAPHLSLHNDRLITEGLMADVHARLAVMHPDWPLWAVADLEVGVDAEQGPGARPVPYAVVSRLIRDACRGLADLGGRLGSTTSSARRAR